MSWQAEASRGQYLPRDAPKAGEASPRKALLERSQPAEPLAKDNQIVNTPHTEVGFSPAAALSGVWSDPNPCHRL